MTTAQELLSAAARAFRDEQLARAGELCQQVLVREPRNVDALHLAGLVAHQMGQRQAAAELLERAAALRPGLHEVQSNLGLVLISLGRFEEAVAACRTAVSLQPVAANYGKLAHVLTAAGRIDEAIATQRKYLELNPRDAAGHYNLGNLLRQSGDPEGGIAAYHQAIALNEKLVEAYVNLATTLRSAGRLDEAIVAYRQAIALSPQSATPHYNLGIALGEKGQREEALSAYRQAIALNPQLFQAHCNLGNVLKEMGQGEQAIASFRRAIAINPNFAEAYSSLGTILTEKGALDEAIELHRRAVALDPNLPEAHSNFGNALKARGELDEAIAQYRIAIELRPDYAEAHYNLANALHQKGQLDPTIDSYRRALSIRPDYAEALSNLGNVYDHMGDFDQAVAAYHKAIAIKPDFAEAYNNLGTAFQSLGRYDEARAAFVKSIDVQPGFAKGHFHLGIVQLMRGEFSEGWREYEWRWETINRPSIDRPLWEGEPLDGRTILLYPEQGFGDTIQFVRYAPLVAARGGKVILECQPELRRLLARIPGVAPLISRGETRPAFDLHCPLLSLPKAFGTTLETIPQLDSYLSADPELVATWNQRVGAPGGLKVGLVWAGSTGHLNDKNRSMKLADLAPLRDVRGATFYSLQKGSAAAAEPRPFELIDFEALLTDFAETAALIANIDLVISVDTSVAHLAAALGKPVWLLLPFVPDWRWMLDREDSPWYPSMRLFRQKAIGQWDQVVAQVAEHLARKSAGH